jgi:hypothetical protein
MTCRDELLVCAQRIVRRKGHNLFSLEEVLQEMARAGSVYAVSTIRTHVTSRMCMNSPRHHAVKYHDFIRVRRGEYSLNRDSLGFEDSANDPGKPPTR